MPRRARLYIYSLALLATVLLSWLGRDLKPTEWPLLLSMIIATVAFNLLRVELPGGQSFTLNSVVNTLAILLGGPALAVWIAAIGQFAFEMIREADPVRTTFNIAQLVVTVGAAGGVFQLLGGTSALDSRTLLAAGSSAVIYFLVNSTLMATLFYTLRGVPLRTVWLDMVRSGVESYFVVQILGLIATYLIINGGLLWSGVWVVLLLLLQRVLKSYYGALRRHAKSSELQVMQDSLLTALVAALDARDIYTAGHSSRVAHYTELLGEQMQLTEELRRELKYASILHDVGKLGIPDSVLRKDGPLSPTERALMMEHPDRGIAILGQMQGVRPTVLAMVRHHHEWYNGGGYPSGISGEQIPTGARVIAVADAFDAMTSARPYRAGMPWTEAVNRLKQGRGTQFDPDVVAAMLQVLEKHPALEEEVKQAYPPVQPERRLEESALGSEGGQQAGRILPVHSKEIEIVYRLAQEPRSLFHLPQTLHRLLGILYDTVGPHLYYILLLDQNGDHLEIRAAAGAKPSLVGTRFPLTHKRCEEMLSHPKPVMINDVTREAGITTADPQTRSVVTIPLIVEHQPIGALRIESRHPDAFGQDVFYLLAAVTRQLTDAIAVARAHEMMAHAASHDGLTGVLNRSTLYRRLEEEVARAEQDGHAISVALLDINDFKSINDTYGHLAGDRAIQAFAAYVTGQLGSTEMIARYGGDEFAIILPDCPKADAALRVEEVARSGGAITVGDGSVTLPAAWGIATFPEDGRTVEELIAEADRSMYEQKRAGGLPESAN